MPIKFSCPCGESLEVDDQYAGVKVSCPSCNGLVLAPPRRVIAKPLTRPRVDEADEDDRPRRPSRRIDDDEEYRPRRRRREDDEDEEEDDRPVRRKLKKKKSEQPQFLEARIFNGGVVSGAIAMLVAVVWFAVGFFAGWVFFYPPILFIIGLVGFIRGLVNRE